MKQLLRTIEARLPTQGERRDQLLQLRAIKMGLNLLDEQNRIADERGLLTRMRHFVFGGELPDRPTQGWHDSFDQWSEEAIRALAERKGDAETPGPVVAPTPVEVTVSNNE